MRSLFILMFLVPLVAFAQSGLMNDVPRRPNQGFTDESQILGVSRESQADALKTRRIKKELTLSEVLVVLTTYRTVSREQYLIYDHVGGVQGTVTLTGGQVYLWVIEPGYAATVVDHQGHTTYLLRPDLEVRPPPANDAK